MCWPFSIDDAQGGQGLQGGHSDGRGAAIAPRLGSACTKMLRIIVTMDTPSHTQGAKASSSIRASSSLPAHSAHFNRACATRLPTALTSIAPCFITAVFDRLPSICHRLSPCCTFELHLPASSSLSYLDSLPAAAAWRTVGSSNGPARQRRCGGGGGGVMTAGAMAACCCLSAAGSSCPPTRART